MDRARWAILDSLEFRDNFAGASFASTGWIGLTWAIVGGRAVNTPALVGGNLLTDPGLEANYTAGKCDTLGKAGSPTLVESADVHGGTKAQQFTGAAIYDRLNWNTPTPTATDWYSYSVWAKRTAGATGDCRPGMAGGGGATFTPVAITAAVYTLISFPYQALSTAVLVPYPMFTFSAGGYDTVIVDDGDLEKITYTDMFLTREFKGTDVIVGATMNYNGRGYQSFQQGVVVALDAPSNPQNFVVGYYDGVRLRLDKVLGRVSTSLITVVCGSAGLNNWEDGELLEVRRTGNVFSLWYGSRQVGTNQTVTDAAIIGNHYVGLYSQSPLMTFNDFDVRAYSEDYRPVDLSGMVVSTYTAGQGICSLRFDDNDPSNYTYVLGELTARGLVGSFALSRGMMKAYHVSEITLAQALAIQAAGNEITCHGNWHIDVTTWADWVRETSQAAEEMRRLGFTIYTWTQSGSILDPVYNLDNAAHSGQPPEMYLLKFFKAYEAYMIPVPVSPYWPLPRTSHRGPTPGPIMSTTTLVAAMAAVDTAIANGTSISAYWHPILFDTVGQWTKADFEAFLDYVAAKVALGTLVVMPITQQLFAVPV